jgi:hypothetical protein
VAAPLLGGIVDGLVPFIQDDILPAIAEMYRLLNLAFVTPGDWSAFTNANLATMMQLPSLVQGPQGNGQTEPFKGRMCTGSTRILPWQLT